MYEKHSSKTEESVGVKEKRSEEEKKREQIWASDVRYCFVLRDLYTGYRLRKIITGGNRSIGRRCTGKWLGRYGKRKLLACEEFESNLWRERRVVN